MPETYDIEIRRHLQFGVHDNEVLTGDYYTSSGPGPFPALIALHGGFSKRGSAEGYQYWGPYLAQRGYALFSINYRLVDGTKNRYPAAVHDTRAAVQFLRSKAAALKVDPDKIGFIGDSAGAHLGELVALAGDTPPASVVNALSQKPGITIKKGFFHEPETRHHGRRHHEHRARGTPAGL